MNNYSYIIIFLTSRAASFPDINLYSRPVSGLSHFSCDLRF